MGVERVNGIEPSFQLGRREVLLFSAAVLTFSVFLAQIADQSASPTIRGGFAFMDHLDASSSVSGTNRATWRLNQGSVVRGNDELRGENVPDGTWRAARSRRSVVHGAHCYLAGIA
jgi:hypothetical protein